MLLILFSPSISHRNTDTVRELLSRVPANAKSELPASASHTIAPELVGEYDLTPLHLAAYSGSEDVVRVLLNSSGVDVEGGCTPGVFEQYYFKYIKRYKYNGNIFTLLDFGAYFEYNFYFI